MKNIKLLISYDGTGYLGWQRLGGKQQGQSIQGLLEHVIEKVVQYPVRIHGSDAGVHAKGQVANFSVPSAFFTLEETVEERLRYLRDECNQRLPEDIRIIKAKLVAASFHSRYSAKRKTYQYYIDTGETPSVFARKYALWLPQKLDIEKMKQAAEVLLGTHDFSGFSSKSKAGMKKRDTVRTLFAVDILPWKYGVYVSFTGDGFLYNMVRIIAGTLIDAGCKRRTPLSVKKALDGCNRELAGPTAPPQGLTLIEIKHVGTKL